MFLFPLLYFGLRQDTITQNVLYANTSNLVDTVCTKGYITKDMYETYLKSVDSTQVLGDIHLEHEELALEPEYRFKTSDEVIAEQNTAFTGTNVYTYVPVTTDIPYVIDPINNSGLTMNTETNASVIASAVNLPASSNHVHTDACYPGATKHLHSAYGGSCYTYYNDQVAHIHSSSCYHTHTNSCYSNDAHTGSYTTRFVQSGSKKCSVCGKISSWITYEYYCKYCGASTYKETWSCGDGGSAPTHSCTYYVLELTCGKNETTPYCGLEGTYSGGSGYNLTCGKIEGAYYNGSIQVLPTCSAIISSIVPTHLNQAVYLNDPLITTVKVTYNDGSTKTVVATSDFTPNTIVQNKIITLSYGGFTKTITVTVIPKSKTCVNGHSYNLNADGSDPGCCYCNSWLSKLDVINPSTSEITIYKGTTLEENGVVLKATFMNGRTEMLFGGYANNLDKDYVGVQTVTLSYKGKYTTINVTTKRNLIQCNVCGKFYELLPDDSNPGCPFCAALIPVFTGNVMKYYRNSYTEDILKVLFEGTGVYYFKQGDYFKIDVTNRCKTIGTKLINAFIPNVSETSIKVDYRNVIRDD